jgi:hypothetical protein
MASKQLHADSQSFQIECTKSFLSVQVIEAQMASSTSSFMDRRESHVAARPSVRLGL